MRKRNFNAGVRRRPACSEVADELADAEGNVSVKETVACSVGDVCSSLYAHELISFQAYLNLPLNPLV